jgi:hypothetical protein
VGAVRPPHRRPGVSTLAILALGVGACATAGGPDAVDVRWYRYGLELRSGDTRYVDALDPAVVEGRRYRVEADARGRIVRVATFIGPGKVGWARELCPIPRAANRSARGTGRRSQCIR